MKKQSKQSYVIESVRAEIKSGRYTPDVRMPTEAEFAQRFKVSRQTIRSALGKLEEEQLITRVQGSGTYVKGMPARRARTGQIAVICTYISEYIFPSILRGVETVTAKNGCQMIMHSTNNSIAAERDILATLLEHPTDGIIVEGTKTALPNPNREFYLSLAAMGIPLVFINGYYADVTGDNVIHIVTDDYAGGYHATSQLLAQGHRNICGIFKSDDRQGVDRYSGYVDALLQRGGNMRGSNVFWFSTETQSMLLRDFDPTILGIDPACSAILCYNDQVAATVVRQLELNNRHHICAVASFDCCLPISGSQIHFVSYPHPREKLGTAAAEKLFRMIAGHREESVVFQWT